MEKEKKTNLFIVSLLITIGLLMVLCALFATDTINLNGSKEKCAEDDKTTTVVDNSATAADNSATVKYFYDVDDLEVKVLDEYPVFKDISNNPNVVETVQFGDAYTADLDLSGNVLVKYFNGEEKITGTINVNNVIDIIDFAVPAPETEQLMYLLTDSGDVYSYRFGEANNKNFNAAKVESVKNVKKLFISKVSKANAGGSWALFAITADNECVMIKGSSV